LEGLRQRGAQEIDVADDRERYRGAWRLTGRRVGQSRKDRAEEEARGDEDGEAEDVVRES